jgi:hypothetical protein
MKTQTIPPSETIAFAKLKKDFERQISFAFREKPLSLHCYSLKNIKTSCIYSIAILLFSGTGSLWGSAGLIFMEEIWKDIQGYEGLYQVSNQARIRGLKSGKIKKQRIDIGYYRVMLSNNNVEKIFQVHRLVAFSFIPNPEQKEQINHINGIKLDNRIENIEWCTRSENAIHAHRIGLVNTAKGTRNSLAKLTDSNVIEIRKLFGIVSLREIGRRFNVSDHTIGMIKHGKTWRHIK